MAIPMLSRGLPQAPPASPLAFAAGAAGLALARGRAHELCGPARRTLAVAIAGATVGPVIWIQPGWSAERLHPAGMSGLCDAGRLVFVTCTRAEDLLWCTEEALRSGAVALVVADLPAPPALTPVRRLHLAAEAGGDCRDGAPPTGLLLTPGAGGAQGVESRWHMTPRHAPTISRWRLERRRARGAEPAAWMLEPGPEGLRVVR
jgi:protein ImuA